MKITIVGGGTAGWIAAYFISKCFPNSYSITVVESSKIGIIGAGEGSTGTLVDLLNGFWFNYKININDFLKKTDATKKFGIRHIGWSKNSDYFAPLDFSPTGMELDDDFLKYSIYKYNNKKTHVASHIGIEYENKIFNNTYALHFDGNKVGSFFKDICILDGVNIVDAVVDKVKLDTSGFVKSLFLDNGSELYSDFFIDCTGFSRKIISSVGSFWVDRSDHLPLNTAMPFIVKHDLEKIDPITKAHAMSSGWMWEIPLSTRKGMGYVFDKNFISEDNAKLEIENKIGKEINPIKIINFKSGYLNKFWNKNVLALGLSSSFVEPLEATSIHNTIIQISIFVKEFLNKNKEILFNKINEDKYNKRITDLNQLTIDFISIHYQGGREDTDFWKYIKNENIVSDGAKEYIELCKIKIPGFINLQGMWGSYSIPLANWVASGMNLLNPLIAEYDLKYSGRLTKVEQKYNLFYKEVVGKRYIFFS
jgi:tryptophan halogenase